MVKPPFQDESCADDQAQDTAENGIPYLQNGVTLEFFKDAACTDKIATWTEADGKFNVSYTTNDTGYVMSITMTDTGLSEINTSKAVYADASMVNSGYSDCTLRITYSAQMDKSANYGDRGNTNDVVLTWKRTNSSYYDTLVDDCHVYVFGLDLTKKFSDGKGDFSKVEFCLQNDADDYYVVAKYDETAKAYYVTGSTDDKSKATRFTPRSDGRMLIYGLEDDAYTITELKTDGAYTLLKDGIGLVISVGESSTVCDVYSSDVLGLIQNDPRYADVEEGLFHNMPQKHLEHKLLTASANVRAKRRYDEYCAKGMDCDYEEILNTVKKRDMQDMTRAIAPLKQADDAVLLDTSDLSIEEVVDRILEICAEKGC